MASYIYEGQVRHNRRTPTAHRFRYKVFMMYLDLGEIDSVFDGYWFWSATRPAVARFRRDRYLGDAHRPLDDCVRDLVEQATGSRPNGRVCLLTNLQYFGYSFNPVSYYYCFDTNDQLQAFVAEVTNTPWGERDCYVLSCRTSESRGGIFWMQDDKKMHVSPFLPMAMQYDWFLSEPGKRMTIYMTNSRDNERILSASLVLHRKAVTSGNLAGVLLRYPFMTLKIIAAIHWQALRLWLKGVPVIAHPKKNQNNTAGIVE